MQNLWTTFKQNAWLWKRVLFMAIIAASAFFLSHSTSFGLEFHPGYTRDNPPPSGFWYSNVPGSYNPWTDDIQMTLLEFPATNEGVTTYADIDMLPAGYSTQYTNGPVLFDDGTWEFVDLNTQNHLLTGTNWVHGEGYQYPEDSWALKFNGEGGFDSYRPAANQFVLSEYRGIAIEVSNLGDTYLIIDTYSKGMRQWLGKGHQALIGLEPGETDIIYFPFRRNVDELEPEIVDFFGCVHNFCGYPGGHLYETDYSTMHAVHGVWGIKATVPTATQKGNVRWSINRMWAGGRYDVPTMEEIRAAGHTEDQYEDANWVDEYGQWKYDDWVGKIWNDQDAIDQYTELLDYVADNPGPSEWNQWGGWEAGPQLEATGWFRVEKYNDRWWFVDPDGKLFLSQGSLHMSANTPLPAEIAGYTDDTFPDEIYFPRLRAMGFNSVGGNSSWKWHEGKMPYTYQIKTGLGHISEDDIVAKGGEQGFIDWMYNYLSQAQRYANDPYCMGFVVDNELKISGGDTMPKDEVERIYFKAVREALNQMSEVAGRPPMIMFDPSSNGGYWMAYYTDVLSMHRMEGYYPATWKDKFDSLGTWGIDRPVGQFTFTMGNMDVGVAHYGLTMFLNQRGRAQGINNFMRLAYAHPNNIAVHYYAYMKTRARPLTEYRFLVNKTDTTDYFLADYVGGIGNEIYRIHSGFTGSCSTGECKDNEIDNNDPPVAENDSYSVEEESTLNVAAPGILDNDNDPNGDSLTAILLADASDGTLVLNPDGSFNYTPTLSFNGTDSFDYMVDDGNGGAASGTVNLTVEPLAVDIAFFNAIFTGEDVQLTWGTVSELNNLGFNVLTSIAVLALIALERGSIVR